VLFGGPRFGQIRGNARARTFLESALVLLLPLRRGIVLTLLPAAAIGVTIALAAGPVSP
jgi:hypothetical protein